MRLSSYSQEPSAETATALTGNPARDLANSFNVRVIFFLSLHVVLALGVELSPWISTVHAVLALLYGLRAALLGRTSQVIYSVAYIAAAEVLWRMTHAHVLWEFAKYAPVAILFVAMVVEWRQKSESRRFRSITPLLLLISFVPAAAITILEVGIGSARDPLSFNLSSYLFLAILALYLWARPIDHNTAVRTLLAVVAPIVSITFLAIYFTMTDLDSLIFVGESNWITSGNYGPNQVSNMMGFGALAASMLFVLVPQAWGARIFVLLMMVAMLVQGLLTFSRGGIYSFVLALAVFAFHVMRSPKARGRLLLLFTIFTVTLVTMIYPFLDQFTGGSLSQRFTDIDTTGRLEAAQADMQAFFDYPFVGVGVGQADDYRAEFLGFPIAAHTEYTRLLGEHGMFGVLTLLVLGVMMVKGYLVNRPGFARAISAGMSVWGLSIMLHSATRLAAIPLALALAVALWQLQVANKVEIQPAEQFVMKPDKSLFR